MSKTPVNQIVLLSGVITVSTGTTVADTQGIENDERTFVANVSGSGAVSATVLVEVSNNKVHWITMATISLSGTTSASDGFVSDESWQFVRGSVTAISGTSASVTLTMGA